MCLVAYRAVLGIARDKGHNDQPGRYAAFGPVAYVVGAALGWALFAALGIDVTLRFMLFVLGMQVHIGALGGGALGLAAVYYWALHRMPDRWATSPA